MAHIVTNLDCTSVESDLYIMSTIRPKENGIAIVTALETSKKHTAPEMNNK